MVSCRSARVLVPCGVGAALGFVVALHGFILLTHQVTLIITEVIVATIK